MGDSEIPTSNRYPVSQAVFSGQTASSSARQHNGNLYNSKLCSPPGFPDQLRFTDLTQTTITTTLLQNAALMKPCAKMDAMWSSYEQQRGVNSHVCGICFA